MGTLYENVVLLTLHTNQTVATLSSSFSIDSRNVLRLEDDNIDYYTKKFQNKKITRHTHWTGFRVEPLLIEFWQDMPFRLHDRVEYKKNKKSWIVKRLYP